MFTGPHICYAQARAKIPATFVIAAFDTNGERRTTGGDAFEIIATLEDDSAEAVAATIRDNEDGTYAVKLVVPRAGVVSVDVSFAGSFGGVAGQLRGFPARVKYIEPVSTRNIEDKNNNRIGGELHMQHLSKQASCV